MNIWKRIDSVVADQICCRNEGEDCFDPCFCEGSRKAPTSKNKPQHHFVPKKTRRNQSQKSPDSRFSSRESSFSSLQLELSHRVKKGELDAVLNLSGKFSADVITQNDSLGNNQLHYAAFNGHLEIIKAFHKQNGINLDARDTEGNTALHLAALAGHLTVVTYLTTHGRCDPHDRNDSDATPLHLAAKGGHIQVMKYLIEDCEADPEARDSDLQTPLHLACANGSLATVQYLLQDKKVAATLVNAQGMSPFFYAVRGNHEDLVSFLAHYRPEDILNRTAKGSTLLHMAVLWSLPRMCELLVCLAPSLLDCKTVSGKTAIEMAIETGAVPITATLLQHWFLRNQDDESMNWRCLMARAYATAVGRQVKHVSLKHIRFLKAAKFLKLQEKWTAHLPGYSMCNKAGLLESASSLFSQSQENIDKFRILFVSHQWDTLDNPDEKGFHFAQVCEFLKQTEIPFTHVWIDYCCCQVGSSTTSRKQVISSFPIPLLASCHMLVLPSIQSSGEHPFEYSCTNLQGYLTRGWCQAEVALALTVGAQVTVCFQLLSSGGTTSEYLAFLELESDEDSKVNKEDVSRSYNPTKFHSHHFNYNYKGFNRAGDQAIRCQEDYLLPLLSNFWQTVDSVTDLLPDARRALQELDLTDLQEDAHNEIWNKILNLDLSETDSLNVSDHVALILLSENLGIFSDEKDRFLLLAVVLQCMAFFLSVFQNEEVETVQVVSKNSGNRNSTLSVVNSCRCM